MSKIAELLATDQADRQLQLEKYYAMCDARDEVLKVIAPLQADLDVLNAQAEEARVKAMAKAAEIEVAWGPDWVTLKRRIGEMAKVLGKVPPRA